MSIKSDNYKLYGEKDQKKREKKKKAKERKKMLQDPV